MSYEDLKTQYRKLAMLHHPDAGGTTEAMQAVNREYDQLFIIWKRCDQIANDETASSTRKEFYTQYGWKGERYNRDLSLKEIACIVREFVKIHYNHCKFSVTTEYASMFQELHIYLTESPYKPYKQFTELTEHEKDKIRFDYAERKGLRNFLTNEIDPEIEKIYAELYNSMYKTDEIKEIIEAVDEYANSFNYDDSDSQIDYFNNNFYFFGTKIGKYKKMPDGEWEDSYKIVHRAKKEAPHVEYENVTITKTRTYKSLEPCDIETPQEFQANQMFQLKQHFTHGSFKGLIYKIESIRGDYIHAYKLGKGYKNVCKGNAPGNTFFVAKEKFKQWLDAGAISFIELTEATKTEEYASVVRRPKKQTSVSVPA
jgi:curved DNA-binding protein CbpA